MVRGERNMASSPGEIGVGGKVNEGPGAVPKS